MIRNARYCRRIPPGGDNPLISTVVALQTCATYPPKLDLLALFNHLSVDDKLY